MNLIILAIGFYINAFLSEDSTAIKIEYSLPKGVRKIQVFYEYKGENYLVGVFNNPYPEKRLKDFFIWQTKKKWRGKGNLNVIVHYKDKRVEKHFIPGKRLSTFFPKNSINPTNSINSINSSCIFINDKYSWRMRNYNAQHTGYYPFPVYPPLELKWRYNWGGGGSWTTEISGCAGHGILFVGKGHPEWNKIMAKDIETGQIIWQKTLTANAMTSILSEGDSILFVGTWIGFTPDSDTTFYALDPFTGDLKWAKMGIRSIQIPPITVDTFVYVPSLGGTVTGLNQTYAYTLRGVFLWKNTLTSERSPAYYNGKVYGPKEAYPYIDPKDTLYIFYCRDALTGDSLWACRLPTSGGWVTIYDDKVFFGSADTLFGLNLNTGFPELKITGFDAWFMTQISAWDNEIWLSYGEYGAGDTIFTRVQSFNSGTGELRMDFYLPPKDTNGGRSPFPLFTYGNAGWVSNVDYIYFFNTLNGDVVDTVLLPESIANAIWPSHFFPIVYKNYFIYAHEDFIVAYLCDTVAPWPRETTYTFKFYPFYSSGNSSFYLSLPEDKKISLKIFDLTGRLNQTIYKGFLKKGEHILNLNKKLKTGIYFAVLKIQGDKRRKKFFYIR